MICECCGFNRQECPCPVHVDECVSQWNTEDPTAIKMTISEKQFDSIKNVIDYMWEAEKKDAQAVEGMGARHIWYSIKDLGEIINYQPWRKK